MNCAQVKEQLVDFLYDELAAETRASFREHLLGCPGCSAEVASHQKALGHARAALNGPLAQDPPARVHAAVMEAARAAARPKAARVASREHEPGFFARLLRTPWFLPAMGAASVATAVFLVRVLKNPEVLPGQTAHSIEERALIPPESVAPAPTLPPTGAPAAAAVDETKGERKEKLPSDAWKMERAGKHGQRAAGQESPAKAETAAPEAMRKKKDLSNDPLSGLDRGASSSGAGAPSRFAEPPPPRAAAAKSAKSLDDLLGSVGTRRSAEAPAEPIAKPSGGKGGRLDRDEGYGHPPEMQAAPAKKAAAPKPAADMARPALDDLAGAPAPSAPAAAPVYAPAPTTTSAPTHATSKQIRNAESKQAALDEGEADTADKERAKEKSSAGAGKGGPSFDESVKKADKLYADQDWGAASAAYRDLLSRFPSHKDAPRWRERLSVSLLAEDRVRQAKAGKAGKAGKASKSVDILDRLKQ